MKFNTTGIDTIDIIDAEGTMVFKVEGTVVARLTWELPQDTNNDMLVQAVVDRIADALGVDLGC